MDQRERRAPVGRWNRTLVDRGGNFRRAWVVGHWLIVCEPNDFWSLNYDGEALSHHRTAEDAKKAAKEVSP